MYKSVVNLIPRIFQGDEYRHRVFDWAFRRYETLTYSIDDALNLVSNARPDSLIRFWNANEFSHEEIDLVEDGWKNIEWRHLPGYMPSVNDISSELPTGAGTYLNRSMDDIFFIAIHHTVGWNFNYSNGWNADNIAKSHSFKWPGIGYHYLIGPDGEILQTNKLETVSYHVGTLRAPENENKQTIGVALGGDFRNAPPPDAQWGAASALVESLRSNHRNLLSVVPHKRSAGAATVCPGRTDLEWWLRRVAGVDKWI